MEDPNSNKPKEQSAKEGCEQSHDEEQEETENTESNTGKEIAAFVENNKKAKEAKKKQVRELSPRELQSRRKKEAARLEEVDVDQEQPKPKSSRKAPVVKKSGTKQMLVGINPPDKPEETKEEDVPKNQVWAHDGGEITDSSKLTSFDLLQGHSSYFPSKLEEKTEDNTSYHARLRSREKISQQKEDATKHMARLVLGSNELAEVGTVTAKTVLSTAIVVTSRSKSIVKNVDRMSNIFHGVADKQKEDLTEEDQEIIDQIDLLCQKFDVAAKECKEDSSLLSQRLLSTRCRDSAQEERRPEKFGENQKNC